MNNPEDEKPARMITCPVCNGKKKLLDWVFCWNCVGSGEIEQDAQDAKDDATEARREYLSGK
jgi:hypothetical protein